MPETTTMFLRGLLLLALVCKAEAAQSFPRETSYNKAHALLRGMSPRPTEPAQLFPRRQQYANQLRARQALASTNTCGYDGTGEAITCVAGDYVCVTSGYFADCCGIGQSCELITSCVNQQTVTTVVTPPNSEFIVCGAIATDTDNAYCQTWMFDDGARGTYSKLQCGTAPFATTVTAAHYASIPSSSAAPSTTSSSSSPPSPTSSTSQPPTTVVPDSPSNTSQSSSPTPTKSNNGTIIGGAVGGVLGALLLAGIIGFIIYRVRVKRAEAEYAESTPEMSGAQYFAK